MTATPAFPESPAGSAPERSRPQVHPGYARVTAYGWRALVLVGIVVVLRWLLGRLWVPVLALVVAVFLTRALAGPHRWLRALGGPPALAALGTMAGFLGSVALAGWLIVPAVGDEFGSLGPTLTEAMDDVEEWLVDTAPFGLDQQDIDDFRSAAGEAVVDGFRSSGGTVVTGAVAAVQGVTGLILGLITTFFFLKDGPRFASWALARVPSGRRELARRLAARAWATLGGYLRGAALLGVVEAVIVGVTLAVIGAALALPVAMLTFAAAFVPFVGAIVAGVVAVLVALATAGVGGAVAVAVVALVVQQLDSDLLAPVVYGRALQLHPVVILFAITAGGALVGFAGTVLAVPVTAVLVNVAAEAGIGRAVDDAVDEAVDETAAP